MPVSAFHEALAVIRRQAPCGSGPRMGYRDSRGGECMVRYTRNRDMRRDGPPRSTGFFLLSDSGQVHDHLAGEQKPRRGGDPHRAGRDAAAARRGRLGLIWLAGLLRRPDHLVVVNPAGTQLFADHPGQGAALGLGDVGHPQKGGVQLISGPQGGDDGEVSG